MNTDHLFNNYCLNNEEIEHVLYQMKYYINIHSYIDGEFNEDLNQEIKIKIFSVLSRNRKKIKNF